MSDAELDGTPSEPSAATPKVDVAGGPKRRGKVRKRHTVGKVLLASVLVLGLATGLGVAFVYRHLNGNLNVVDVTDQLTDRPTKVAVAGPQEPLNVLVMGSDTRDGAGNKIDGLTGGGERSDTTIPPHPSAEPQRAHRSSGPPDPPLRPPGR